MTKTQKIIENIRNEPSWTIADWTRDASNPELQQAARKEYSRRRQAAEKIKKGEAV